MRLRTFFILAAVLGMLSCVGCAPKNDSMYYWGDYYKTYYDSVKSPCEATKVKHVACLDNIIAKSTTLKKNVPPGIYAEYGYYKLQSGKPDEAIAFFEKEKSLYPESQSLMDRLIATASLRNEETDDAQATPEVNPEAALEVDPGATPEVNPEAAPEAPRASDTDTAPQAAIQKTGDAQ